MHDSLMHFLVTSEFFNKNFKVNLYLRDLALIFLEYSFIKSKSYIETIFIPLGSIPYTSILFMISVVAILGR